MQSCQFLALTPDWMKNNFLCDRQKHFRISASFLCIYPVMNIPMSWIITIFADAFEPQAIVICAAAAVRYNQCAVELMKLAAMPKNTNYPIRLFAIMLFSLIRWHGERKAWGVKIINMSYRFKHSSLKSSKLNQIHIFICRLNVAI